MTATSRTSRRSQGGFTLARQPEHLSTGLGNHRTEQEVLVFRDDADGLVGRRDGELRLTVERICQGQRRSFESIEVVFGGCGTGQRA